MFYVYIHCRPDGTAFYVGKGHGNRSRSFKKNRNLHYRNIVAKYGAENIQVSIIPCESEAAAFSQEVQLIKAFRDLGYELANVTDGGEGPSGMKHSAKTREKMTESRKGVRFSDEHKAALSVSLRSCGRIYKPLNPEHKRKFVAAGRSSKKGIMPWNKGLKKCQ